MSGPSLTNLILIWTAGPCLEAKQLEDVLLTSVSPLTTREYTQTSLRNSQNAKCTCIDKSTLILVSRAFYIVSCIIILYSKKQKNLGTQ